MKREREKKEPGPAQQTATFHMCVVGSGQLVFTPAAQSQCTAGHFVAVVLEKKSNSITKDE